MARNILSSRLAIVVLLLAIESSFAIAVQPTTQKAGINECNLDVELTPQRQRDGQLLDAGHVATLIQNTLKNKGYNWVPAYEMNNLPPTGFVLSIEPDIWNLLGYSEQGHPPHAELRLQLRRQFVDSSGYFNTLVWHKNHSGAVDCHRWLGFKDYREKNGAFVGAIRGAFAWFDRCQGNEGLEEFVANRMLEYIVKDVANLPNCELAKKLPTQLDKSD